MQNLESLKSKGQDTISNLLERGKQQPDEVKTWGVTAAAGVGGAVAVAAAAKGVLAIAATLAAPPVALTVGAVGGGVLGWNWIQKQQEQNRAAAESSEAEAATPDAVPETPVPFTATEGVAAEPAEGRA